VWNTADGPGSRRGIRDGFDANGNVICKLCFDKKLELDRLREENHALKLELRRVQQKEVIPLGAHSPSSQKIFKKKSSPEKKALKGGATVGHKGSGRRRVDISSADTIQKVSAPEHCVDCQSELSSHGFRERSVYDVLESDIKKTIYQVERKRCPSCSKVHEAKLPFFPRALYSNALLSKISVMHYLHGVPMGRVCEILGPEIKLSGVLAAMHRLAEKWHPIIDTLIEEFRRSPVKHADETGWRTDGQPGWAWLFCTPTVSIFDCQDSRSSRVPKKIFGDSPLQGVLVVDRFGAYNKLPCQLQYCYAHLLREVKKLDEEFSETKEVTAFCQTLGDLLSSAMTLPAQSLSDEQYYERAIGIASQIKILAAAPSSHLGIQDIQRIFSKREDRLFQWALNRNVPAHNNRAERELRQTVIARKVSFGSQSERGAKTRATLMSILTTARKRLGEISIEQWFKSALDQLVDNVEPKNLLPPVPT